MSDKYYVVAGNHDQYRDFIKKKAEELWADGVDVSLSRFVYATPDSIKGIHNPHGWFYGTWRNRKDIQQLVAIMKISSDDNTKLEEIFKEVMQ